MLFMNLVGLIPSLESPTMFPVVTCGLAIVTFIYYHVMGLKVNGPVGYFKQFMGPACFWLRLWFPLNW